MVASTKEVRFKAYVESVTEGDGNRHEKWERFGVAPAWDPDFTKAIFAEDGIKDSNVFFSGAGACAGPVFLCLKKRID